MRQNLRAGMSGVGWDVEGREGTGLNTVVMGILSISK